MFGRKKAGRDDWLIRGTARRKRLPPPVVFRTRHPVLVMSVTLAFFAGGSFFEAARMVAARHTVGKNWALGAFAGFVVAASVLALLVVLFRRGRPTDRQGPVTVVITIATIGVDRVHGSHPGNAWGQGPPSVVTSPVEEGELAYVATVFALLFGLLGWASVRLIRRSRSRNGGAWSTPAYHRASAAMIDSLPLSSPTACERLAL